MGKKLVLTPFTRVEGDLKLEVDIKNKTIVDVHISGIMFRGIELILEGRDPVDALVFTPRICGICNLSHSVAASKALKNAYASEMPLNAYYLMNVAHACEIILNNLTHFYLFFLVDFINKRYEKLPIFEEIYHRFAPMTGVAYIRFIKRRKKLLELLGILIGKWPNALAFHPGGVTKSLTSSDIIRALGILYEFKSFLKKRFLGCSVEEWLENKKIDDIEKWLEKKEHANSDLGFFIRMAQQIGLHKLGISIGKFLCFGAFKEPNGTSYFKSGYFDGEIKPFNPQKITEHIKYSWYDHDKNIENPLEGKAQPDMDKLEAYSWIKAPRYDDNVVEVGPLARLLINKDPLIIDYFQKFKANVFLRILAKLHESLKLLKVVEEWLKKIDPEEPFYKKHEILLNSLGVGLTEAPRGALGHWIIIENGKIKRYQIITPSTWNFSPRDSYGRLGVVEQTLLGMEIEDEENPVEIYHVIRSFDPCLVCSTHIYNYKKSFSFKI